MNAERLAQLNENACFRVMHGGPMVRLTPAEKLALLLASVGLQTSMYAGGKHARWRSPLTDPVGRQAAVQRIRGGFVMDGNSIYGRSIGSRYNHRDGDRAQTTRRSVLRSAITSRADAAIDCGSVPDAEHAGAFITNWLGFDWRVDGTRLMVELPNTRTERDVRRAVISALQRHRAATR